MYGTKAGVRKVSVKSAVGERRRGVLLWKARNNGRSSNLGAVPEAGSEQPRGPRSEWCNLSFLTLHELFYHVVITFASYFFTSFSFYDMGSGIVKMTMGT